MKIQRTIPPAAAPVDLMSILHGIAGFFMGKRYIKKVESEIKSYFGVNHVFLVSSGKAALTLILQALKFLSPNKREVLIPAYTCFSVPSAIVRAGLKVSLCDIDPTTLDFDYKLLSSSINEKTLCVIPSHLFGIPSKIDKIISIVREQNIFVVEDAAQAMGGIFKGRKLGTLGDVGFFSLGRGKNITCGSGGIIVTNSNQIALAISKQYSNIQYPSKIESFNKFLKIMLLAIFIHPSLYWFPSGLPFLRLGETIFYKDFPIKRFFGMRAGLLNGWQRKLEESNKIRREHSEYFDERLKLRLRLSNGNPTPFLRLPFTTESREVKKKIYSFSQKSGLGISLMYPTAINEIEEIKATFNGKSFPSAERIAETLLTIPTHQFLSEKDKEKICIYLTVAVKTSTFNSHLQKADYWSV
jgi:perosamine synthetase